MVPAPPSLNKKSIAFYDTECYPNFWLLKIRLPNASYSFSLLQGEFFNAEQIKSIRTLFGTFTTVSFNGIYYDIPMITAAIYGYKPAQLKWLNDQIIVEKKRPWELGLPEWKPTDHIDIMEVAPGAGSQKQYAGRIHCKTMRDLPYDPGSPLTPKQIEEVALYCKNDLDVLKSLFYALQPQITQREQLGKRYGIDLRSKSDAQVAETVLKLRCGARNAKPQIDPNFKFKYKVPGYINYELPQLKNAVRLVSESVFRLGQHGTVEMPSQLEGLQIIINQSAYKIGIGGLHSQETKAIHRSDEHYVLRDNDVASYYPSLILNSGECPPALGQIFLREYASIKDERLAAKALQAKLKKNGDTSSKEYTEALVGNEGGKIMINGTFGKTGSPYSVLFAPTMLIQTTITGQLSLLMLIEAHEANDIPVISANTDGIVIKCPRNKIEVSTRLIDEWQKITNLEMETSEYQAIYSRDVNNYFAIKCDGEVKRKGEYSKAGLLEKKNPDVEICSDAVAEFLANGIPIEYTIAACRDIRKFVTIQKVNGGGIKLWGEGPRKGALVRDMMSTLADNGWSKDGRKWRKGDVITDPTAAYKLCFKEQTPQYLGKVVRWYYSTEAPGPIVYASNGNTVGLSYGAHPCMTLPDEFPGNVDYMWYINKAKDILCDIGLGDF